MAMQRAFLLDTLVALGLVAAAGLAVAPLIAEAQTKAAKRAWKNVALEDWQPASAPNVLDLAAPAMMGFPETLEGRPAATVELSRSEADDSLLLVVSKSGLADDSVGAEQYRLEVVLAEGQWQVRRVAKRWQCRRGITKGQWTTSLCP
jgi:hypothetical protein